MKSLVFFVPVKEPFAFLSIRQNLIRIPEVLIRLKEAERLINNYHSEFKGVVDLISIMQSDWSLLGLKPKTLSILDSSPEVTLLRKKLTLIVSCASQVGLFDRYIKSNSFPEFVMTHSDCAQATLVSLKHCSMKKMIQNILSQDFPQQTLKASGSYAIFKKVSGKYQKCAKIPSPKFKSNFERFTLKENLKVFLHLGPGQSLHINFSDLTANQFTELELISTDPLLSWFWSDIRLPVFSVTPSIAI